MKEISGFDFYESLRYILPGYFLLFLTAPLLMPEYWTNIDATEKITYGFIIGFFMHSFDIYKWVPGVSNIKKEYLIKYEKITGKNPSRILSDVMSLTFAEEKYLFKRYYGFGALKLDIVAILIFTIVLKIYSISVNWTEIQQSWNLLIDNFIFVIPLFIVAYVVRYDGINDMKIAFNIELFVVAKSLKEEHGEMKKIIAIEKENKDIFFLDERKNMTGLRKWISTKIRLINEEK